MCFKPTSGEHVQNSDVVAQAIVCLVNNPEVMVCMLLVCPILNWLSDYVNRKLNIL